MNEKCDFIRDIGNRAAQTGKKDLAILLPLPETPSDDSISVWQSARVDFYYMDAQYSI